MSKIDAKQKKELDALAKMSEADIDTSDIPEVTDWSQAQVGRFYRPVKKQVTLRIDMDVMEWFKAQGNKYQTRMNSALREFMEAHR